MASSSSDARSSSRVLLLGYPVQRLVVLLGLLMGTAAFPSQGRAQGATDEDLFDPEGLFT